MQVLYPEESQDMVTVGVVHGAEDAYGYSDTVSSISPSFPTAKEMYHSRDKERLHRRRDSDLNSDIINEMAPCSRAMMFSPKEALDMDKPRWGDTLRCHNTRWLLTMIVHCFKLQDMH